MTWKEFLDKKDAQYWEEDLNKFKTSFEYKTFKEDVPDALDYFEGLNHEQQLEFYKSYKYRHFEIYFDYLGADYDNAYLEPKERREIKKAVLFEFANKKLKIGFRKLAKKSLAYDSHVTIFRLINRYCRNPDEVMTEKLREQGII